MKTLLGLDQQEMLVKTTLTESYLNEIHSRFCANVTKRVLLLGVVDTEHGFEKLPVLDLNIAENYFREVPLADFSILSADDFRDENTTYCYTGLRQNSITPILLPFSTITGVVGGNVEFVFNRAIPPMTMVLLQRSYDNGATWENLGTNTVTPIWFADSLACLFRLVHPTEINSYSDVYNFVPVPPVAPQK